MDEYWRTGIPLGVKDGRGSEHPIYFSDVGVLTVGDCMVSIPEGLRARVRP